MIRTRGGSLFGDVVEPLGDQAHAVVQHEDAGGRGRAPGQIHEHDVAVVQGGQHAIALDMHDRRSAGFARSL